MTQDEIIEMACQAFGGLIKKEERDNFIAFADLVADKATAKEREACAKLCEKEQEYWGWDKVVDSASLIRVRRGQA